MGQSKFYLGSIDLTKIDKSKIVDKDKDGNRFKNGGKYINVAVSINEDANEYGQHGSITMRDDNNHTIYLGNFKEYEDSNSNNEVTDSSFNDLPF